jgi:hypothetical protein
MYRKILVTGVTAAAIVGAGATALAVTGDNTTSGTPSGTSSSTPQASSDKQAGKHAGRGKLLRRTVHGQIVTKGKDGFVTHDLIRGTVSKVSLTSITIVAADKKSETFSVGSDTKVRSRADGKGSPSTIGKVTVGDTVFVLGTGTGSLTARHIVDLGKK